MATHNLAVVLTGNATSLRGALLAAGRDVEKFEKQVANTGRTGQQAGSLMQTGLKAGILAVGVAMAYSIAKAVEFDTQLRNLQSITKQTDAEIGQVGKTLIGMSTQLPQSAATLAEGLYQIASSGFKGAEGLEVLDASARAASAGLTTTEVAAKAITSVLNAYGLEAAEAADVSDILFQAVNVGVVTFEELSTTIGDVVGTAAAATVEIDEVSSAIATMTLSGISASEAGTSLNRLIQSLIDPSEDLAAALQDVGYESGASALQTDSLSVVIEKLRVASQGNIETLLKWFPEIRAARGALALMSNEGKNYASVVAQIENEENRAQATQKALNEQMKAVSAQWQIFVNRINAAAITAGTKLLPVVLAVIDGITQLARYGIPILMDALERLGPFFTAVWQVAQDVVQILVTLGETAGPVVAALAGLAGMGVITALNALAEALSAVTGVLAEHPNLVKAVALVLASVYLPAVLTSTAATLAGSAANLRYAASFKLLQAQELLGVIAGRLKLFGQGIGLLVSQMSGGESAIAKFKGAFAGLGSALAVGGALVAVTMAVQEFTKQMDNAKEHGQSWAKDFAGNFNPAKVSMGELEAEIQRLTGAADDMQGAANNAINPFLDKRLKTARDELRETAKPLEELRDTAKVLQQELGITSARALELANDQDFMAGATDGATGELDKEAAAALEAVDALAELSNQLKAMYDPLFAAQDAADKLAAAQMEAAAAARDHGAGSMEAVAANREAVKAAVDYQAAIVDLKNAVASGDVQIETAISTLYAWVDAGILSEEQARQAEREFRGWGDTAEDLDGTKVIVSAHAQTDTAKQQLVDFRRYLDSIPRTVTVTVNGRTGTRPNLDYRQGSYGYAGRWGGVVSSYAGGGIHAHVAKNEMIRYAEPETGGEAFVPRRGDHRRSSAVLSEAASWYGYRITPMAAGGITRPMGTAGGGWQGPPVRLELHAAGVDRALLEWLRKSIRIEGGGDVQLALGASR